MKPDRLEKLSKELAGCGIDAGIISAGPNLKYLMGLDIDPHERTFLAGLSAGGKLSFALPMLEMERVRAAIGDIGLVFAYQDQDGPELQVKDALKAVMGRTQGHPKVGAEFLHMRVKEYEIVRRVIGEFEPFDIDPLMMRLRSIKDDEEAACLRRAAEIVDIGIDAARDAINPGASEKYVSQEIERAIMAAGADYVPFNIVLSGPNAALPHGIPSERRIKAGELVLCDIGACYKGYFGDITRTIPAGRPSDALVAAYDAVYRANEAGRRAARPGMTCEMLDAVCRKVIEDAGFGPQFIHRTGHGLGLEVHEEPYIVAGNKTEILPGMAFTIEPGVYIPGVGGVRIEDDVIITQDGTEILTRQPRELFLD